jgi:PAS domain S-box-containing protein
MRRRPTPTEGADQVVSAPRDTDRHNRFKTGDELTRLMETLPAALVRLDRDWTIAYVNANAEKIYGRTRDQLVGLDVWDAFPEARGTIIEQSYRRAMDTGEPDTLEVYFQPLDVHFDVRIWPDAEGLTLFFHDVNDRVRAQQALDAALRGKDAAARRLADLNAIALELTAAETVDDLEQIVVGRGLSVLGSDGGAVVTRDGSGGWRMTISAAMGAVSQAEYGVVPYDTPLPGPWAARNDRVLLLPTRESGLAFHPVMGRAYENTGRSGWAFLPLTVRDRRLGCLAVSWTDEHVVDAEELELLEGFAAQCAQTLDRILGREAQRAMAARAVAMSETLQRSLLSAPAELDDCAVAVRYRPALEEAQVGGDWYDSFLTSVGVLTLVVGDITGHDQQAAAVMGQARNLLRGVAYTLAEPPAAVLSALDRALRDLEVRTYATVLLGNVEQTPEQAAHGLRTLRWSNAGHPPPLLLRADGSATLLGTPPNRLLGVDAEVRRDDHVVVLGPGDLVLLYTDGLIERRGMDLDDGLTWLTSTAADLPGLDHEQLCDALLDLVEGHTEDDVALLALRVEHR